MRSLVSGSKVSVTDGPKTPARRQRGWELSGLAFAALGVVFGDIDSFHYARFQRLFCKLYRQ